MSHAQVVLAEAADLARHVGGLEGLGVWARQLVRGTVLRRSGTDSKQVLLCAVCSGLMGIAGSAEAANLCRREAFYQPQVPS